MYYLSTAVPFKLLSLSVLSFAMFSNVVFAEESTDSKETADLESIVIYGDRSAGTLFESNSSIAIVNDKNLVSPANQTMRDAFKRMVNVNNSNWTEGGFVIRGVSSEGLTPGGAGAPLASFYIDGVQQTAFGSRRGARSLFDVEQLEVYRGPQSTLTGRNALAGAIYMRTKDPEFESSGRAQLTYGENNLMQGGLAYGDALSDNIAYRISGQWSKKDSDINYPSYKQYSRFDDFANDEYYQLRGKLLWLPAGSEDTRVLFSYSHSYDSPEYNDIVGSGWNSNANYDDRRGDLWGEMRPSWATDPLPIWQGARSGTVDNFGVEATHDINNNMVLTAMTGLSQSTTQRNSLNEGTPGETTMVTEGEADQQVLSQEVRISYNSGALQWVAGGYVAKETLDVYSNSQRSTYRQSKSSADITNLAIFADVSYELIPEWRVLAGGRIDSIDKKQDAFSASDGVVRSDTSKSFDELAFIPKLGIEHQLNKNNKLSLIYQAGYRSGGSGIRSSDDFEYSYDSEKTDNLELSWRGSFLQNRLSVGANIFYQDWQDQQVSVRLDSAIRGSGYIVNAGESESYGMEVDFNYVASNMLSVYASVGLLKTEFKDFIISQENYKGLPFANAPETSIALGFHWGRELGWFGAGSAKHTSSAVSRLGEGAIDSLVTLDAYNTVDAELGYAWKATKLTAYAINMFDEEFFVYEFGPGSLATLGERREIGVRLDYEF